MMEPSSSHRQRRTYGEGLRQRTSTATTKLALPEELRGEADGIVEGQLQA